MQLLHISYKYISISDFVYQIDNLEDTIISTKAKKNCVILSTIHSSKGLEFDSVIVVDDLSKNNPKKNARFIKFYNQLSVEYLYVNTKELENINEQYKKAKEQENERDIKNQINKNYVALSRAKDSMFIYKRDDGKSDYEFIDNNMIKKDENKLHKIKILSKTKDSENKNKIKAIVIKIDLQNDYTKSKENKENKKSKKIIDNNNKQQAQKFGTAIHYALEAIRSFEPSNINYAISKIAKFKLNDNDICDIKKRLNLLLTNKEFLNITQNGIKHFEQEYIYENERKIIDLLIIKDKECIVIDYKTSDENVNVEHNTKQIKQYCEFVNKQTNKTTKGFLVHLNKDSVVIKQIF
jgi:ATP-dependent exoDNAse (exonuclease V) beta subunit